jgi:putative aldouronate transport system permease protein
MILQTRGEKIFDGFNVLLLTVFSLSIILPFYFVFTGTLVTQSEYLNSSGFVLWPKTVTFEAYKLFFNDTFGLIRAYAISISRVVVGTSMNIIFTGVLAYVLSKKWLPGRNVIMTMVFVTMNFSGGLIPTFIVVKSIGLRNTFWAMIIPGLIGSFYMIILRNFFSQVPESLTESAYLDGAGELTILFRIVFPLSLPSIATIALFYAVGHWNAWFDASIYINNEKLYPLQLILRKIIIQEDFSSSNMSKSIVVDMLKKPSSYALKNTAIFYTTLPILCVYPFAQKYFVKGVLTGSIKG